MQVRILARIHRYRDLQLGSRKTRIEVCSQRNLGLLANALVEIQIGRISLDLFVLEHRVIKSRGESVQRIDPVVQTHLEYQKDTKSRADRADEDLSNRLVGQLHIEEKHEINRRSDNR